MPRLISYMFLARFLSRTSLGIGSVSQGQPSWLLSSAFSQAPRPDEGIPDLFQELEVTLEYLASVQRPGPD